MQEYNFGVCDFVLPKKRSLKCDVEDWGKLSRDLQSAFSCCGVIEEQYRPQNSIRKIDFGSAE